MTVNSATLDFPPLPFRLRTALGVLLVGFVAWSAIPRLEAAYRLLGVVNRVADYGLCMAGPTGAVAIQQDPTRFRVLLRRRLVASSAEEQPFARCAKVYGELTGRDASSYSAQASAFLEWGGGGASHNLNELDNDLPDLEALAKRAYPFSRKPLSELVVPSLGAKEAIHPSDPAVPGIVRGLETRSAVVKSWVDTPNGGILMFSSGQEPWAYRSRDGRTWNRTSAWQSAVDGHANRCVVGTSGLTFGVDANAGGRAALQVSDGFSERDRRVELGGAGERVAALACDETGAVVLTKGKNVARVFACPAQAASCRELKLPEFGRRTDVALDVARVARTVVVAISKDGLVRVTTSRDEGVTMTPLSLVFDAKDAQVAALASGVVPTLLPLGKRLLLQLAPTAGVARGDVYALLSEDYGASFRGF